MQGPPCIAIGFTLRGRTLKWEPQKFIIGSIRNFWGKGQGPKRSKLSMSVESERSKDDWPAKEGERNIYVFPAVPMRPCRRNGFGRTQRERQIQKNPAQTRRQNQNRLLGTCHQHAGAYRSS